LAVQRVLQLDPVPHAEVDSLERPLAGRLERRISGALEDRISGALERRPVTAAEELVEELAPAMREIELHGGLLSQAAVASVGGRAPREQRRDGLTGARTVDGFAQELFGQIDAVVCHAASPGTRGCRSCAVVGRACPSIMRDCRSNAVVDQGSRTRAAEMKC